MLIGEIIKAARIRAGYTQLELAQLLPTDVRNTAVSSWENNKSKPDIDTLIALCEILDIPIESLFPGNKEDVITGWHSPLVTSYKNAAPPIQEAICAVLKIPHVVPDAPPPKETVDLITFNWPAAAGIPIYAEDDFERRDFEARQVPRGTDFAVRIAGDSMEPTIHDGDYVFVRRQSDLHNGEVGVFMLHDESVCKRFYSTKDGVRLESDNAKYEPIVIKKNQEGFALVGKVIGWGVPED